MRRIGSLFVLNSSARGPPSGRRQYKPGPAPLSSSDGPSIRAAGAGASFSGATRPWVIVKLTAFGYQRPRPQIRQCLGRDSSRQLPGSAGYSLRLPAFNKGHAPNGTSGAQGCRSCRSNPRRKEKERRRRGGKSESASGCAGFVQARKPEEADITTQLHANAGEGAGAGAAIPKRKTRAVGAWHRTPVAAKDEKAKAERQTRTAKHTERHPAGCRARQEVRDPQRTLLGPRKK